VISRLFGAPPSSAEAYHWPTAEEAVEETVATAEENTDATMDAAGDTAQ